MHLGKKAAAAVTAIITLCIPVLMFSVPAFCNGYQWVEKSPGVSKDVNDIQVMSGNANKVVATFGTFATGNEPLYSSQDGGSTWNTTAGQFAAVTEDKNAMGVFYAATDLSGEVYKSTNGGGGWTKISTAAPVFVNDIDIGVIPNELVAGCGFSGGYSSIPHYSNDGGVTWNAGACIPNSSWAEVAADPTGSHVFYAGSGGINAVYKSMDGGVNWAPTGPFPVAGGTVSALAVVPAVGKVFCGFNTPVSGASLYESIDGGANWTPVAGGYPVSSATDCIYVNPVAPFDVYAATGSGIYWSSDQGATWTNISGNLPTKAYTAVSTSGFTYGTLYAGAADGSIYRMQPAVPGVGSVWYLAEGTTAWGYDCYISIENPNNETVTAQITYMTGSGSVPGGDVYLPPMSQTTVYPRETLGDQDFSTRVECTDGKTIAVDRTMGWSPQGTGAGVAGDKHCSVGVTSPSTTWYLPEGSSNWGFECWHLIQNPNDQEATVNLTYMIEGEGFVTASKVVPANSRASYNMETEIGQKDASLKVQSNLPVIPERAMYKNNRQMGHDSIGTTEPANNCYLAEGTTAWGFTTYVLVQNPQDSETTVNVTYMTPDGPVAHPENPINMPAYSRKTIRVNDYLTESDFSTKVTGVKPIIAERAMYWGEGTVTGEACHDSIGMDSPHMTFYLPAGQVGSDVETWTLVQNPNGTNVEVTVSYLPNGGGTSATFTETIAANSRMTFSMGESGLSGGASVLVQSNESGKPIMVERAMYWYTRGAGSDTIGGHSD